jgi:hypothetical protein
MSINNIGKNDWYCHNICNYTKLEDWNNTLLKRRFPKYNLPPMFDPRPDFKICGNQYVVQPTGKITSDKHTIITQNPTKLLESNIDQLNLNPYRNDRDCFFCRILNNMEPGKPNYSEYLRRIDIDSYTRGLTQFLTKCSNQKTNPNCLFGGLCPDCSYIAKVDPTIVKIIDRWQSDKACFQLPVTTDLTYRPRFYNGCPGFPIENAFNNRTKALDNAPIEYNSIRLMNE